MATGLSNRQTRDGRDAADHVIAADATTTDAPAADVTVPETTVTDRRGDAQPAATAAEVDGVRGATAPRSRLATARPVPPVPPVTPVTPVPPGGAVAPVPPGGAVAPVPPEKTQRLDPVRDPVLLERDRAEAIERDRAEAAAEADPAVAVEPVHRARTSFTATISLIIGVSATLAALSGRLAPAAVAVGLLGMLFAAAALVAVSRRHVTGHHVALLGLAFSIAGFVFGILAINRSLPWLDGGADQAGALRDWLNAHLPWLSRW
jgi:hypothetical protein